MTGCYDVVVVEISPPPSPHPQTSVFSLFFFNSLLRPVVIFLAKQIMRVAAILIRYNQREATLRLCCCDYDINFGQSPEITHELRDYPSPLPSRARDFFGTI